MIHHTRMNLIDHDNLAVKGLVDGLVRAGVLEDDSPEFVEEVANRQTKGKVEETRITIEVIEEEE